MKLDVQSPEGNKDKIDIAEYEAMEKDLKRQTDLNHILLRENGRLLKKVEAYEFLERINQKKVFGSYESDYYRIHKDTYNKYFWEVLDNFIVEKKIKYEEEIKKLKKSKNLFKEFLNKIGRRV